jgi:hypothetical protein
MSEATEGSLGPAVIAVAWVSATLALAIVIARFYVRLRVVKSLKVDDCIILLTLVSAIYRNEGISMISANPLTII